jgi:SAM-dependent methyltransferase
MDEAAEHKTGKIIGNNIAYYNGIAPLYDEMIDADPGNKETREYIARAFVKSVPKGAVLDFGGGTGRDLDWLVRAGYKVVFCEPSISMREKASRLILEKYQNKQVAMLNDANVNFLNWNREFPFETRLDGILANFAVLNCIPSIHELFAKFSLVSHAGTHVFLLVLNSSFKQRWRSNRLGTLLSFFNGQAVVSEMDFMGKTQYVYLYSLAEMKKAWQKYFLLQNIIPLKNNDFLLIHLVKK